MTVVNIEVKKEKDKQVHAVLLNNNEFRRALFLNAEVDSTDSGEVVEYAKRNFNDLHTEATSIVNDPNRKVVSLYLDDYSYLLMQLDDAQMDSEGYFNLLNEFIERKNLRGEFNEFLNELKKDDETLTNMYFGDIEEHILDFE